MRRFSLVALSAVCTLVSVGLFASPAWADKSIQATLGVSCANGQVMTAGTFTMTGVTEPRHITVNTIGARSYAPSSFGNNIVTYNIPSFDGPLASPPAVATVPSAQMGNFSLTSATCVATKAPNISPSVSPCGMNPVSLTVGLRNNNPLLVKYTVTLSGFAAKTIELGAGASNDVDFQPLTLGSNPTLTVSGGGLSSSNPVAVDSCAAPPGPGPAPTAKPPAMTASPTQTSTTPEATMVAQSVSASPNSTPTDLMPVDSNTPSEEGDRGPFDTESSTRLWMLVGIAAVFVSILVILFVIFGMRNRDEED